MVRKGKIVLLKNVIVKQIREQDEASKVEARENSESFCVLYKVEFPKKEHHLELFL